MSVASPSWMQEMLSPPRFARYLAAAHGDRAAAINLYCWNVEVSAAFYGLLHCLEISLRNALHDQLRSKYQRSDWWHEAPLNGDGRRTVGDVDRLLARRRPTYSADDVVAELNFGFWVSLLSRGNAYDRTLWVPTLHRAFPYYSGLRRPLHDKFESIRRFRNRVMHYEPIYHRHLAADREKIYRLLGYLSRDAPLEVRVLDRVPSVLARRNRLGEPDHAPRF